MEKYTAWRNLPTKQSKEILSELMEAKEHPKALLLIADTGLGKSNTIEMFCSQFKQYTYCITVGDSFKLIDVVDAILEELDIEYNDRFNRQEIKKKLAAIANKMKQIKTLGHQPIIILDEAENLKPAVLKMIKELYDAVIKYCSIVLIGTEYILDMILNRKNKNRQSVPQLWRRFKAGKRDISPLNKQRDFQPFFNAYIPGNMQLQTVLLALCENYGELHDYLHPVLLKASQQNKAVTLDAFRYFHKLPNMKIAS